MIKIVHYYSGLTIALFVGAHLCNHLMILRSESLHVSVMKRLRRVYRFPAVEGVLLIAVAVQMISGVVLVVQKWSAAEGLFDWLQIGSGLYLAFFLTNHVRAVLVGRHKLGFDTNLYYGAGVMNMWPQKLFFIPYYALAVLSFFTHVACIHRTKMQEFMPVDAVETQSIGIIILGIVVTFLIIARMSHLTTPVSLTRIGKSESGRTY